MCICIEIVGADQISIGSDAVTAAEQFYRNGDVGDGSTSIEQISRKYGAQVVEGRVSSLL